MKSNLKSQIRSRMNLKETGELIDIWQSNNRGEWSDDVFSSIEEILKERGEKIPEQNSPIYETEEKKEVLEKDGLDEWEAKAVDDENQPEFYETYEVILLKDNIHKTMKAVIVVNILLNVLNMNYYTYTVGSFFPNEDGFTPLIYFLAFIVASVGTAVSIAIVYFPLKALAQVLRILMEMEFNSRKVS